jgi:hypothetical protein
MYKLSTKFLTQMRVSLWTEGVVFSHTRSCSGIPGQNLPGRFGKIDIFFSSDGNDEQGQLPPNGKSNPELTADQVK